MKSDSITVEQIYDDVYTEVAMKSDLITVEQIQLELLKTYPYYKRVKSSLWEEQVNWLLENYGEIGSRWEYFHTKYWFKTEEDLMWFTLRWT